MRMERCTQAVLLAMLLAFAMNALRPRNSSGINEGDYWLLKTNSAAIHDIVLVGDSRIKEGVSPEAMNAILPSRKILNFAYDAVGLDREYLREAESKLNPASPQRLIVIGLTPRALTESAAYQNSFINQTNGTKVTPHTGSFGRAFFAAFANPFLAENENAPFFSAGTGDCENHEFFADGWAAVTKYPEKPLATLEVYRRFFAELDKVSPRLLKELVDCVATLTARGIRVVAFRVPAYKALADVENNLSGYDEAALSEQLKHAGAEYLSFDRERYRYFDGSHMQKDSALKFSVDLAHALEKQGQ